ncbi:uncharacterized protein LOC130013971 [Patella vulgata]|uniref:uncharacterized protein LOC130013971 n=1 Tax=Patella vulgata TaxID=6465 RepID=UPI0024A8BC88|nr:uncharacterized protein LOC130013971 [Patella vulgata]
MANELIHEVKSRIEGICNLLDTQNFQSLSDIIHDIHTVAGIVSDLMCSMPSTEEDSITMNGLQTCLFHIQNAANLIERKQANEVITGSLGHSLSPGHTGRPSKLVPFEQLEFLVSNGFKLNDMANLFNISPRTMSRRLLEYGISLNEKYSHISNDELDEIVIDLLSNFPNIGYRSIKGHLHSKGHIIQEYRVRESMIRVDIEGVLYRRLTLNPVRRRRYSVRAPNSLWHIDGYHKLISWHLVVHGGIDGYSRLPTYLKISNNNRAETVMQAFNEAVQNYGLPWRVRSDKGGENVRVAEYMINSRGFGRGSHITGRSVHNQRIERFWRDLWMGCISFFYYLFCYMEAENIFIPTDEIHIQALHYIFIPRIQKHLNEFREAFIRRSIRTANQKTPLQLWIDGQILDPNENLASEADFQSYGTIQNGLMAYDDEPERVVIGHFPISLTDQKMEELMCQINPLFDSENQGMDLQP